MEEDWDIFRGYLKDDLLTYMLSGVPVVEGNRIKIAIRKPLCFERLYDRKRYELESFHFTLLRAVCTSEFRKSDERAVAQLAFYIWGLPHCVDSESTGLQRDMDVVKAFDTDMLGMSNFMEFFVLTHVIKHSETEYEIVKGVNPDLSFVLNCYPPEAFHWRKMWDLIWREVGSMFLHFIPGQAVPVIPESFYHIIGLEGNSAKEKYVAFTVCQYFDDPIIKRLLRFWIVERADPAMIYGLNRGMRMNPDWQSAIVKMACCSLFGTNYSAKEHMEFARKEFGEYREPELLKSADEQLHQLIRVLINTPDDKEAVKRVSLGLSEVATSLSEVKDHKLLRVIESATRVVKSLVA